LKGKTFFITGASRGIGAAIAKRVASEGANIVLAAKTTEPHSKLPGTIFSVAKEIEQLGGKALPLMVDVREESQIADAVKKKAVERFGGIDVVVNNASAIWLKGTTETPMKRYDLMMGINVRGTYATSQACLPYLIESAKKGRNPQILNLAPPLNISQKWFENHVAYTMSKYGMAMCVLGMSGEFKKFGIGVNALWPRTGIATAAIELIGGSSGLENCRTVDIMSDAAFEIFKLDGKNSVEIFLLMMKYC